MANTKDTFQVWRSYGTGTGGYRMLEPMTEAELAARTARQKAHQVMLERQDAYESSRQVDPPPAPTPLMGCVFAKSCNLPSGLIDYHDPTGFVPLERLKDYGENTHAGSLAYRATRGRNAQGIRVLLQAKIATGKWSTWCSFSCKGCSTSPTWVTGLN